MIELYLQKLNFNPKEIDVYLSLLKNGKLTPAALAKKTRINRATVYSTAKSLINKGVVVEDLGGKSLYLVPLPPENLSHLINKERKELEEKEDLVKKAVQEASLVQISTDYPVPRIRFIEESGLEDSLYENAKKWNDSAMKMDKTWWGFQDHTLVEHYDDWIHWLWKEIYKDTDVKLLSNQSVIEQKFSGKYKRRQIKFWKKPSNFTATTWIIGDYVIVVNTKQHPYYLVEMHDSTLAHNLRQVFQNIWEDV